METTCSGIRKPKKLLTLKEKKDILNAYDATEGNVKLMSLAKSLNISRSTLITTINNRQAIENAPEEDQHRFRTRNKRENPYTGTTKYKQLEEELLKWILDKRQRDETINGVLVRSEAKNLGLQMGFQNFTASNGWIDRFKKKYKIEYKLKSCGCSKQKPQVTADHFLDALINDCKSIKGFVNEPETVDIKLSEWLNVVKADNIKVNDELVKEMAVTIAAVSNVTDFVPSSIWLVEFLKNHKAGKYNKCSFCLEKNKNSNAQETTQPSSETNQLTTRSSTNSTTQEPTTESTLDTQNKNPNNQSDERELHENIQGIPVSNQPLTTDGEKECSLRKYQEIAAFIDQQLLYRKEFEKMKEKLRIIELKMEKLKNS